MKPLGQVLVGFAIAGALMVCNAVVEFIVARPTLNALTIATAALAAIAAGIFQLARPR